MQYLRIQGLSKRYGDQLLFEDIDLLINKGEKVALVASNGSGKSSMVRALADVERADAGEIEFARDVHVEFLMQDPELEDEASVLENVLHADNAPSRAVLDYERCLRDPGDREGMAAAVEQMDASRAWDYEQRVKETLFRLALTDLGRTVAGMSGGERKRVALARVLVNEPDFLVLDEPTNHLDLEMIEWLEGFLTRTNLTLLLITHDRYFLERVCTRIVELDDGELHSYSGNYAPLSRTEGGPPDAAGRHGRQGAQPHAVRAGVGAAHAQGTRYEEQGAPRGLSESQADGLATAR